MAGRPAGAARRDALTLRIEQEHQEVNRLVVELERCPSDDAGRVALIERTFAVLDRDVRNEEDELLPRLRTALDDRALRLGDRVGAGAAHCADSAAPRCVEAPARQRVGDPALVGAGPQPGPV